MLSRCVYVEYVKERNKRKTQKEAKKSSCFFLSHVSPMLERECSITPEVTGECKIYSNKLRASRKSVFNMINVVKKKSFHFFCLYFIFYTIFLYECCYRHAYETSKITKYEKVKKKA